jgi:SpoVK/Ycf46/Vps4 family AAA+-type ATPase
MIEYLIAPLGSSKIKEKMPKQIRRMLFYGPSGSGKTFMVRAIANATRALILDVSPQNLSEKIKSKQHWSTMMAVAKTYQPCILYMDNAELLFPVKKKGGGGIKGAPK